MGFAGASVVVGLFCWRRDPPNLMDVANGRPNPKSVEKSVGRNKNGDVEAVAVQMGVVDAGEEIDTRETNRIFRGTIRNE